MWYKKDNYLAEFPGPKFSNIYKFNTQTDISFGKWQCKPATML